MRKRTIRLWLKWSMLANVVMFLLALLDYLVWDSAGIYAVLGLYAVLLVGILVLLIVDERPGFQRLVFHDEPESKTVIYPKR